MSVQSDRYFDERMETLPPDQLRKLQDHRLRWQFRRCWDGSEWYRARFEAAGLSPETFGGLADLDHLPLVTRQELETVGFDAWRIVPHTRLYGWISPHERSRTKGDHTHDEDRMARAVWAAGADRNSDMRLRTRGLTAYLRTPMRRRLPPIIGKLRERPMRSLGPRSEAHNFAYECIHLDGFHWAGDHTIAEILDQGSSEAVEHGKPGELIVTDLVREASPVIRLRTGLIFIASTEPCKCGRTGLRIWTRHGYRRRAHP